MLEIIPGILEKEWKAVERKIGLVSPFAKTIHIDLLDGKFAPNTTLLDPTPFTPFAKNIFFELHMMVHEPIMYIEKWAKAGFRRFIGHIEQMSDQAAFVAKAQLLGEVGLALDRKTPASAISVPLIDLDNILIMTINAGFSGQQFMPEQLDKVRVLRQKTSIPIEVDGGINDQTIGDALRAGATRFVTTSFLFGEDPSIQIQKLRSCISGR